MRLIDETQTLVIIDLKTSQLHWISLDNVKSLDMFEEYKAY